MIKRILNRLAFEFLKGTKIRRAGELLQNMGVDDKRLSDASNRLSSQHAVYVARISRADMAASLELSALVYLLCTRNRCTKMLDLGSGFSSLVLRLAADETPSSAVWSVDDNTEWLEVTRTYLLKSPTTANNLLTLDRFIALGEKDFDFILLDLNYVEVRKNYITLAVERCKRGGFILFDDVHKREFMTEVLRQTKRSEVRFYDLESLTRDHFGRYALLAIKQ